MQLLVSSTFALSSRARWTFYIATGLLFNATAVSTSAPASDDQIPRCSELQSDAKWDYCVEEANISRNWYEALAACKDFGGELVSLEWPEKIDDLQERLNGRKVNLSNGVFVNAHRPFYSANGFAWSSGMELPLEMDTLFMEECVKYSSFSLHPISCGTDFETFPLVCQRVSLRKVGTSQLENLFTQKLNVSRKSVDYSTETCDYFSLGRLNYNWYQAKAFCETINSELLGVPRNDAECQIVDESLNMRVNGRAPPKLMLNMHSKMYARNGPLEIFRDLSGKTIKDSNCKWSDKTLFRHENTDSGEKYCVLVEQSKTLSPVKCSTKDPTTAIVMTCRQCRPNIYNQYVRKGLLKTGTQSTTRTSAQSTVSVQTVAVSTPVTTLVQPFKNIISTRAIPSIGLTDSSPRLLITLLIIIFFLTCVLLFLLLPTVLYCRILLVRRTRELTGFTVAKSPETDENAVPNNTRERRANDAFSGVGSADNMSSSSSTGSHKSVTAIEEDISLISRADEKR